MSIRTLAGVAAICLVSLSGLCALTVRDALVSTEMVFIGEPWLVRLVRVEIDGLDDTEVAVDVRSSPWLTRQTATLRSDHERMTFRIKTR